MLPTVGKIKDEASALKERVYARQEACIVPVDDADMPCDGQGDAEVAEEAEEEKEEEDEAVEDKEEAENSEQGEVEADENAKSSENEDGSWDVVGSQNSDSSDDEPMEDADVEEGGDSKPSEEEEKILEVEDAQSESKGIKRKHEAWSVRCLGYSMVFASIMAFSRVKNGVREVYHDIRQTASRTNPTKHIFPTCVFFFSKKFSMYSGRFPRRILTIKVFAWRSSVRQRRVSQLHRRSE